MSNFRYVRSLGEPYFAFTAENVGDLSTLPDRGLVGVGIEYRVDRPAQQNASADELHPLFSFAHDLQTQPAIFEVGITPSGRLKAVTRYGLTFQTGPSRFADSSRWHTALFDYDESGDLVVNIDDAPPVGVSGAGGALLPNAGYSTRLMLFNGRDGLTRAGLSLRRVTLTFADTAPSAANILYDFHDDYTDTIEPDFPDFGSPLFKMPTDCVMRAAYYDPVFSTPWGNVPSPGTSPDAAYRWGLGTEFTRLAKPTTKFTRVPA